MIKLVKVAFGAVVFAMLAYVFFAVPFGERTLYGYAVRVFSTPEAKEAGAGIKEGAGEYLDHAVEKAKEASTARAEPRDPDGPAANGDGLGALPPEPREPVPAPMDEHAPADEAALRDLLGSR